MGDLGGHHDEYDFKSENVIELLQELKAKFQDDKVAAIKAETDARNEHLAAQKARMEAKKAAQLSTKKKEEERGRVQKIITDTETYIGNEEHDLEVDSKGLRDTKEECSIKRREWEDRSEVRENEIKAIDTAISIMAKVTGVRTEAPGNPIPPASPVSDPERWDHPGSSIASRLFLQVSPDFLQVESQGNPKMSAVLVLHEAAEVTHSRALERLAVQIKAHLSGPFQQINNMIEKMIFRLMDEQKQEDEHKDWCQEELKSSTKMKEHKEERKEDTDTDIKAEKAKVAVLNVEIETADNMTADIIEFMEEATEIRQTGKKENKLAIKDAEDAQK